MAQIDPSENCSLNIHAAMAARFWQTLDKRTNEKVYTYNKREYTKKGQQTSYALSVEEKASGSFMKRIIWSGPDVEFARYEIPVVYEGKYYLLQSESKLIGESTERKYRFKVFSSNGELLFEEGVKLEGKISREVYDIVFYSMYIFLELANDNHNLMCYITADGLKSL